MGDAKSKKICCKIAEEWRWTFRMLFDKEKLSQWQGLLSRCLCIENKMLNLKGQKNGKDRKTRAYFKNMNLIIYVESTSKTVIFVGWII